MRSSLLLLSVLVCLSRSLQIQNKLQQDVLSAKIENGNEILITKDEGSDTVQLSRQQEISQLNNNVLLEEKEEEKTQPIGYTQEKEAENVLNRLIDDSSIQTAIGPINEDKNVNADTPGPVSTLQMKQDDGSSPTTSTTETTTNPDGTQDTVVVDESKHNLFFGENDNDSGNFEPKEYTPILTVLVVAVMGLLFILILSIKYVVSSHLKPFVARRLRYVSRDVLIIMIVLTIMLFIDFQGVSIFNVDMMGICLYWSIAALTWFAYCAILAWLGHSYSKKLDEKESKVPNQNEILEKYQKLSERIAQNERLPYNEKSLQTTYEAEIAYFLLRQTFICPSHLPPVAETFMRHDFDFAEYMTLCVEKVLDQVFTISWNTFFSILFVAVFWMVLQLCTSDTLSVIVFCAPIFLIALITLIIKAKFLIIEKKLRSLIGTPQGVTLFSLYSRVDPAANLGNRVPLYVSEATVVDAQTSRKKAEVKNAHERLFWFASPKIWLSVLHMLIMIQLAWAVIFYAFYAVMAHTTVDIVLAVVSTVILLTDLLITIPTTLFVYTTITNIEMMKDRELIRVATLNRRKSLQFSLIKLYRALKTQRRRRRAEVPDEGKIMPLKGFYLMTIDEAIDQISPNDEVRGGDLPVLAHLCGSKLEKDELITLARELGFGLQFSADQEEIPFEEKLTSAIEQRTQDVKNEPYQTSFEVLSLVKPHENTVKREDLETFLTANDIEIPKEDFENINHEMKYLSPNGVDYDLFDLSSLIRNDIEQHARCVEG